MLEKAPPSLVQTAALPEAGLAARIVAAVPDLIYLFRMDEGRNVYANRELVQLLGYTPAELQELGADLFTTLVHPEDLPHVRESAGRIPSLRDDEVLEVVYRMRRADGTYCWFRSRDLVFTRDERGAPLLMLGVAHDITPQKEADEALRKTLSLVSRLRDMAAALSAALTPEQVADVILAHSLAALAADGGAVRQISADGAALEELGLVCVDQGSYRPWRRIELEQVIPATDAVRERRIIALGSRAVVLAHYPHLARTVEELEHDAFVAVPLIVDGRVVGSFSLWFSRPHRFSEDDLAFLELCAQQCAQALERARLHAEVQAERARLLVLLRQLPVAVIIAEAPDGRVVLANDLAERISRFRYEPIPATEYDAIQPFTGYTADGLPYAPEQWPMMRALRRGEVVDSEPITLRYASGEEVVVLASAAPVRDDAGAIVAAVTTFVDITELQRARAEAEAAVKLRNQFLSIAAHELKTPLTSLLGSAQLLQRRARRGEALTERNERALDLVVGQARRLDRMISMLLDVQRIESGHLSLSQASLDLAGLVARLADEVRPTLAQHTLEVATDGRLTIVADELRLEQVFLNLLQNAVKYSPGGGRVVVSVFADGGDGCVTIADEGIGIPADSLPKLFQRFYRAPNVGGSAAGMGIGLYVVREIVTLHGGTVGVVSQEGRGSTFTVRLPLR